MTHTKFLIIGIRPCDIHYPIRGELIGQIGRGIKDNLHRWYDPVSTNEIAKAISGAYYGDFRLDKKVNGKQKYVFLAVDLRIVA